MKSTVLTDAELLMIEQLCREGELQCARRASLARRSEDHSSASYENRLQGQYRDLRRKVSRILEDASAEAAPSLRAASPAPARP